MHGLKLYLFNSRNKFTATGLLKIKSAFADNRFNFDVSNCKFGKIKV